MQYHQYLEGWPEKKIVLLVQGSHSGNLLWSFELSQHSQLAVADRTSWDAPQTHNETHNEIPSQFLQALQYLWVWGKWDLLVRWLRRKIDVERLWWYMVIMAASWLFGDFTWFYWFCSLLWNCSLLIARRRWGSYASERLVCMPGAEASIVLWSPVTMQLKSDGLSVCNDLQYIITLIYL